MVRVTKLELHRTISDIMKTGDLDHLTTKKIRILCENKYNIDLSSRKEEIDRIVMAFVNKHCDKQEPKKSNKSDSEEESESEESEENNSSGSSGSSDSDSGSESDSSESELKTPETPEPKKAVNKVVKSPPKPAPVPKKVAVKRSNSDAKKSTTEPNVKSSSANSQGPKKPKKEVDMLKKAEIDDAEFARKLQASEFSFRKRTANNLFRDNTSKKTATNDPTKKKSSAFQRKCLLSPALAEVLGTDEMSRPDVVQKMWSIIRERNLFDQSNKQYALLDEQLRDVFGTKRVRLMGMLKYLKKHIKDVC